MSKTTEAMKQAQHLLRWTHFGECRTYQGPVPEAREVDKLLSEAIATEEAQWVEPVARVKRLTNCSIIDSTGCAVSWEGLSDGSVLFTRPAPSPADHIGDATKLGGERGALITQHRARAESAKLRGTNYSPCVSADELLELLDMLAADAFLEAKAWHRGRDAGIAEVARVNAQQVAVPQENDKLCEGLSTGQVMQKAFSWCPKDHPHKWRMQWIADYFIANAPQPPQADALAADHVEDVRAMVPMTDMEVHELWWAREKENPGSSHLPFARAIERHHKIGVKP